MELFDTHFHFYGENTPVEFLARVRDDLKLNEELFSSPVEKLMMLAAGGDYIESLRSREFAQTVPDAWFACGVHPHQAADFLNDRRDFSEFRNDPRLCAIGEIGLDYFYDLSDHSTQCAVLEEFLRLALEWNLPAMLHLRDRDGRRDAYADALSMLTEFHRAGGRFVIHCFAGTPEDVERFLALDAMIGVTGLVTFRAAGNVRASISRVPLERLMIETDSPYLAPVPFRGRENTPGMAGRVAAKLAEERQLAPDEAAKIFTENAKRFYRIEGV